METEWKQFNQYFKHKFDETVIKGQSHYVKKALVPVSLVLINKVLRSIHSQNTDLENDLAVAPSKILLRRLHQIL